MAALVTVIAGRFSSTYTVPSGSPLDLGVTDDPGYKWSFTPEVELVKDTDAYGAQAIEGIWLAFSDVSVDFVSKEYKAAPVNAITPFATFAPTGAQTFAPGLVGRRATDLAGSLIFTATASTPAAATPATMTFTYAFLHEGHRPEIIFGPRHRKVPIRFRIYPYNNSGAAAYATAT